MHSVKSKWLDKIYVISPSDTPLFLWKVKIIWSEKYIKIRLLNDRNITWYVRLSAFDEDTIELINKLIVELPEIFESSYEKKARKNTANQIIKTEEKIERKNTTKTISEVNYILEKSLDLIVKYEGFTQVAKWDRTHYSRWYGTKAPYAWAKITKKDAKKELHNKVKDIIEHVSTNFPHTNINQKISLVSFFYNNWTSKKWKTIFLHKLENMWKKVSAYSVADTMWEFITSGWKKLRWLERRRNEEVALFLSWSNNF
jgi:GH24 family phage-related lysozyme (muramidase)